MKRIYLIALLFLLSLNGAKAQVFYHKAEILNGNVLGWALTGIGTGVVNWLCDDFILDSGLEVTSYGGADSGLVHAKMFTDNGIFDEFKIGCALGYLKDSPNFLNWGCYGSLHYKTQKFNTYRYISDIAEHRIHNGIIGAGVLLNVGDIESPLNATIDVGLRYYQPIGYSGSFEGGASSVLNGGLASRCSVTFKGVKYIHNVGLYVEIPHYNLFKDGVGCNVRCTYFGFTMSVGPWWAMSDK